MFSWYDYIPIQIHPQPFPDCNTSQSSIREGYRMVVASGTSPKFSTLKHLASSAPVLAYFNPSHPVELSVDTQFQRSSAVLLQNDHPIAYASRALADTQQQHAQIKKEMLAVAFGCTKFHDYIYGMSNVEVFI